MMAASSGELGSFGPLGVLEIVDRRLRRALAGPGLGVVLARAGAGKSTLLAQLGLIDLLHGRNVLHLALGRTVDQVKAHYQGLLDALAGQAGGRDWAADQDALARRRVIKIYGDGSLTLERVQQTLATLTSHLGLVPATVLVDGFDWSGPLEERRAAVGEMRAMALALGASVWVTATSDGCALGPATGRLPQPCTRFADLVDLAVLIEPLGERLALRLLGRPGDGPADETLVILDSESLLPLPANETGGRDSAGGMATATGMSTASGSCSASTPSRQPAAAFTLLSGAADGAEAEFGLAAERHGCAEVNFSFAGRQVARHRGLVVLGEDDLRQGDVSFAYLSAHLHRQFPRTVEFRKIMQSIWHQVSSAGEVFAVGVIQPDQTFRGGTGWAAELARRWHKPIHVFDQERGGWFAWHAGEAAAAAERTAAGEWVAVDPPRITHSRFCGTGTRALTPEGQTAIRELFERSFGPSSGADS